MTTTTEAAAARIPYLTLFDIIQNKNVKGTNRKEHSNYSYDVLSVYSIHTHIFRNAHIHNAQTAVSAHINTHLYHRNCLLFVQIYFYRCMNIRYSTNAKLFEREKKMPGMKTPTHGMFKCFTFSAFTDLSHSNELK